MSARESIYNILDSLPDDRMPYILNIMKEYAGENKDPFYSDYNMSFLRQSIREANEGRLTHHELIEVWLMYKLWSDNAWEDYIYWQKQDKKLSGVLTNY